MAKMAAKLKFFKQLRALTAFKSNCFKQKPISCDGRIEDDPLKLLKLLGSDLFQTNYEKRWLLFNMLMLLQNLILHIIYFFSIIDTPSEFLNYVLAFNVQVTLIINHDLIENVPRDLQVWTQAKTVEAFARIQKNARFSKIYTLVGMSVAVLAAISVGIMDDNTKRLFLALEQAEILIPDFTKIVVNCVRVVLFFSFYTMSVHAFQLIYLGQHVSIQIELLAECASRIGNDHRVLVFCIKRYAHIAKFVEKKSQQVGFTIVPFAFTGGLLGIGVAIHAYQDSVEATYITYLQVVLFFAVFLYTFAGIIQSGQMTENQSEKILVAILSNSWYAWDVSMQRDLVIFLGKLMRPLRISYLGYFEINYKLGLAIMKTIYSLASVMLRLNYRG